MPSVSFGSPYNCCAGCGWAAKLLDTSGSAAAERLRGGKVPSVSFGLPYNCCAGSGWAAKLLDTSGSGAAERLRGRRCHPSVSDYHIAAVLGLAGPRSCLTHPALVLRSVSGGEGAIRQFRITI